MYLYLFSSWENGMIQNTPHTTDSSAIADKVIYLHGFRASHKSRRVNRIEEFFTNRGIPFFAPSMNCPDFENLTVDAMMDNIVDVLKTCPNNTMVMCASMSTVPLLNAVQQKRPGTEKIHKIVLTGPVFNYATNKGITEPVDIFLENWKRDGRRKVSHRDYIDGAQLHYEFAEQMCRYNAENIVVDRPTLLIHGTDDEIVDFTEAVAFHDRQTQTTFHVIDGGDHDLNPHVDAICDKVAEWAPTVKLSPPERKRNWIHNVWNKRELLQSTFSENMIDFGHKARIMPLIRRLQKFGRN